MKTFEPTYAADNHSRYNDFSTHFDLYANYYGVDYPVTSIGKYAFHGCESVESVEIPSSVTTIGEYAFENCSKLRSLKLPPLITKIPNGLVENCENLISIEMPESVTTISAFSFLNCKSLTYIEIPKSVTYIGIQAFYDTRAKIKILGEPELNTYAFSGTISTVICKGSYYQYVKNQTGKIANTFDVPFVPYISTNSTRWYSSASISCRPNEYYELEEVDATKYKIYVFEGPLEQYSNLLFTLDIPFDGESHMITALKWNTKYTVTYGYKNENGDLILNTYTPSEATTSKPGVSLKVEPNQISAKVKVTYSDHDPLDYDVNNVKVVLGTDEYQCDNNDEVEIPNLKLNTKYEITANATYFGGRTVSSSTYTFTTKGIVDRAYYEELTPTYATICGKLIEGNVKIVEHGFENMKGQDKIHLTGLIPNTKYTYNFYALTDYGYKETKTVSFTTPALELSMLEPRCVSEKCAIVAAETNLSDLETKAGFQWKKYDAPTALKPSEAYAAIYDGQLEGYIKNLQSTYYNVRAFFEDADGNRTYTDWVMFDPTDFSFFEPTVHTYPIQSVSNNEVSVRGYVLAGSDPIISQGFQYWKTTGADSSQKKAPSADKIVTVTSSGQVMTATINGLEPGTDYVLRSFVETAAGYTYGEEQTFTTTGAAAIGYIVVDAPDAEVEIVGYYDLMGRRYDEPQKGFNIVVYSDGTSRKEFMKF